MEKSLKPYNFESRQIRVHMDESGEPWFVAKDVCDVLGLGNATEALRPLDDDEKSTLRISEGTSPRGGNPNVNIISESGLYTLIIRSNKPVAKPFRRWVTHEVLRSIRLTGSYQMEPTETVHTIPAARYVELLETENAFLRSIEGRRNPFRRPKPRIQAAIQLFKLGRTGEEIASKFGVHRATVYRWIKKYGSA